MGVHSRMCPFLVVNCPGYIEGRMQKTFILNLLLSFLLCPQQIYQVEMSNISLTLKSRTEHNALQTNEKTACMSPGYSRQNRGSR